MSRVGRLPIGIPAGVEVKVSGPVVRVAGPKGTLERSVHQAMRVAVEDGKIVVSRQNEDRFHRALHGLTRALIANMVQGVTKGYRVELEIQGVGYRAVKQGANLTLQVGFSHPVELRPPAGVQLDAPAPNRIVVSGSDKEAVGQTAASIRAIREPDPYKGKGIRYLGERVRRKPGKAGKAVAGAGAAGGAAKGGA
ncbi:MAG: 50S ribosomal protein L6 [Bacillati bacterium ANGP1]|uniref:Large ribosomal subunit protein uL6 n=1 Tax=Candidatus Segetimicrobium genomatis TaxID=2569760 RepID=A0A537JW68_9BACT|nr:MAG: 50S ribosomal protein L6 [Terrabacteria group bacterium ANGP1]